MIVSENVIVDYPLFPTCVSIKTKQRHTLNYHSRPGQLPSTCNDDATHKQNVELSATPAGRMIAPKWFEDCEFDDCQRLEQELDRCGIPLASASSSS